MNTIRISLNNGTIFECQYKIGSNPLSIILPSAKHDLSYDGIEDTTSKKDILPILIKNRFYKNDNMLIQIYKEE